MLFLSCVSACHIGYKTSISLLGMDADTRRCDDISHLQRQIWSSRNYLCLAATCGNLISNGRNSSNYCIPSFFLLSTVPGAATFHHIKRRSRGRYCLASRNLARKVLRKPMMAVCKWLVILLGVLGICQTIHCGHAHGTLFCLPYLAAVAFAVLQFVVT